MSLDVVTDLDTIPIAMSHYSTTTDSEELPEVFVPRDRFYSLRFTLEERERLEAAFRTCVPRAPSFAAWMRDRIMYPERHDYIL